MLPLRTDLDAARLTATGVLIAVLVHVSRLAVYAAAFSRAAESFSTRELTMVAVGTTSAFLGSLVASWQMDKITIGTVRYSVASLMLAIGAAIVLGVIA